MQRIEGVEELLHRLLLVGEELDVIEQEDVALLAVARAELRHAVLFERVDEVVGESLAREVDDVAVGVLLHRVVADRVHEVRLAEAHAAVEEERVVRFARSVGDSGAGRDRELVRRSDHEGIEGVLRVDLQLSRGRGIARRRRGDGRSLVDGARFRYLGIAARTFAHDELHRATASVLRLQVL